MTTYQKFKKLKIDFSAIEFQQAGEDDKCFCTPIGARIIGRAGVDCGDGGDPCQWRRQSDK